MRETDIIVVAPCNAQVNALRDALPPGIRVGAIDKFQGQEAPIRLVSMTASSAEETPRGMDFLFSLSRIGDAGGQARRGLLDVENRQGEDPGVEVGVVLDVLRQHLQGVVDDGPGRKTVRDAHGFRLGGAVAAAAKARANEEVPRWTTKRT